MPASQHIGWCFTVNQPDRVDLKSDLEGKFDDKVRYAVWSLEAATTTGHKHFQGYLEMNSKITLTGIKKLFAHWGAHWEARRGTREQARDYCMGSPDANGNVTKEGFLDGPWECGDWEKGGSGARNDLKAVVDMLTAGNSLQEIAATEMSTFIKYHKGIERTQALLCTKRNWKTEVFVLYGATGTGKSRTAWEAFPDAYEKAAEHEWWDGYAGEETVIIDDFNGELNFRYLLRLTDRYPMQIQVKGGMTQFRSKRIVITTNRHPDEWYHHDSNIRLEDLACLKRRITKCVHLFHNPDTKMLDSVELFNNNSLVDEVAGNTRLNIFGTSSSNVHPLQQPEDAPVPGALSPSLRSGDGDDKSTRSITSDESEVKSRDPNKLLESPRNRPEPVIDLYDLSVDMAKAYREYKLFMDSQKKTSRKKY